MLRQVLQELESAPGPVNINELSQKLGIEQSALEGMIQFWVRKGRLKTGSQTATEMAELCTTGSCGCACAGTAFEATPATRITPTHVNSRRLMLTIRIGSSG